MVSFFMEIFPFGKPYGGLEWASVYKNILEYKERILMPLGHGRSCRFSPEGPNDLLRHSRGEKNIEVQATSVQTPLNMPVQVNWLNQDDAGAPNQDLHPQCLSHTEEEPPKPEFIASITLLFVSDDTQI
uniref:Uncharacterized protein n=1 Tax=Coccidioides posadasii RMSCC 3488 TaxID=454284 RepID=A0A0J6FCZ1_COCPO|nr:hypothetical protein CPAG_03087 [Coccidioides posadasii RMSCC 3488]